MLQFIGCGSSFNAELGNNSAFFKIDNGETMYLIDCGSSIFERIIKFNLLDGVKRLVVLITHMHPDHVGSLGDLIFYTYYIKGFKTEVFYPKMTSIYDFFSLVGVNIDIWEDYLFDAKVSWIPTKHVKEIPSWGYELDIDGNTVFYSGDSNEIIRAVIDKLSWGEIGILYQDTCGLDYEGNVHLYYGKLRDAIPTHLRHKVWCMHLDKAFDREQAIADGFNVVEPIS